MVTDETYEIIKNLLESHNREDHAIAVSLVPEEFYSTLDRRLLSDMNVDIFIYSRFLLAKRRHKK